MGQIKYIKFVADTSLIMLFSFLPTDIIHHILSYTGVLKLRNGKYMGQISNSDKRYELLLKISRKIYDIHMNYGYFVRVNEFLRINIYLCFNSLPLEYCYNFRGRKVITYFPK